MVYTVAQLYSQTKLHQAQASPYLAATMSVGQCVENIIEIILI